LLEAELLIDPCLQLEIDVTAIMSDDCV